MLSREWYILPISQHGRPSAWNAFTHQTEREKYCYVARLVHPYMQVNQNGLQNFFSHPQTCHARQWSLAVISVLDMRGLGLVDHVPLGCVAKINIPWPWPWPWYVCFSFGCLTTVQPDFLVDKRFWQAGVKKRWWRNTRMKAKRCVPSKRSSSFVILLCRFLSSHPTDFTNLS